MRCKILCVFLLLSGLVLFIIPGCGEKDDVAAIRELIKKGADHAEKHEIESILKLAAEEKAIRENPVARTSDILKTVFGN